MERMVSTAESRADARMTLFAPLLMGRVFAWTDGVVHFVN